MKNQKRKVGTAALAALELLAIVAGAQQARVAEQLDRVTRAATFTFVQRDGNCITGNILRTDAATVTVQNFDKSSITIERDSLLRVIQGNALLFSARSSWADVVAVDLYPREGLVVTLRGGKQVKGKPVKVSADSIALKHGLSTTRYPKRDIAAVDYLRVKPPTDSFNSILQEAPYALMLSPEFYYRITGLEGRIRVRLYDVAKPEDDAAINCASR